MVYLNSPPPAEGVGAPGLCTSVVAQDLSGQIHHGRNLDWNIPVAIRKMLVDVDFIRSGVPLYTGTTAVGFLGVFNGMRRATTNSSLRGDTLRSGYSISIDARKKGGKLLENLLEALFHHGTMTPAQHLRKTLETATTFDEALHGVSTGTLVDDVYYIVGGSNANEGAIVARDRNSVADTWKLDARGDRTADTTTPSDPDGWFRLETNYDRLQPVPKADDRRTPGVAHMRTLGQGGVAAQKPAGLWSVITQWPTFNHHTDYSAVMCAATGTYQSFWWDDGTGKSNGGN